jgi:DNA-binding SARP family transcriptional activator
MVDGETKAETRSESGGSTGSIREPVRVRLLGGFSVRVGDRTVERDEWRLRKAAALVKLLALAPDHRRHRDWIMDRLWPELGKRSASNNLRRTLHAARKALDPAVGSRYLASEDEQLALCPVGPLWVDVEAFEAATATARREREPAAYRAALDLYAEELLPADRYEEWAEVRRRELRQLHLALLAELAAIHEDRSEHDPAIDALRRVVAEEPVREEGHTSLMRLYALSGRQSEALRQYEILREALTRELGTEPSASSLALREEIARGLFSSPAAGTIPEGDGADDAGKHNLPAQRTSFVGREREMAEVKRALAMTRLLTLSGAGGSGKTRLSGRGAARAAGPALRRWAGSAGGRRGRRGYGAAGATHRRQPRRVPSRKRGPAGDGQLRAPRGSDGEVGRRAPRFVPALAHTRDQPGTTWRCGGTELAGTDTVRTGRTVFRRRGGRGSRGHAIIRRACILPKARVLRNAGERAGGGVNLSPSRRHPARDRTRCCQGRCVVGAADSAAARRFSRASDGRR